MKGLYLNRWLVVGGGLESVLIWGLFVGGLSNQSCSLAKKVRELAPKSLHSGLDQTSSGHSRRINPFCLAFYGCIYRFQPPCKREAAEISFGLPEFLVEL